MKIIIIFVCVLISIILWKKYISYEDYKDEPYITVMTSHGSGLNNKIQVIMSYLYKANKEGKKLRIIWVNDNHCPEDYKNLFEPIPNVDIVYSKSLNDDAYDYKNWNKENNVYQEEGYYKLLKPIKPIQKEIDYTIKKLKEPYIACHVRRTDSIGKKYIEDITYDDYKNFIDQYDSTLNIYISTDCAKTQQEFIDYYKDRLVYKKIGDSDKLRQTSVQDAVKDMFVCASALYFKGVEGSTFSQTIFELRKVNEKVKETFNTIPSEFDWEYYINNNSDIPIDVNSEEKAVKHYNEYGKDNNYVSKPVIYGNNSNNNTYVSIIAIFKNETMIIEPWIKHHLWQGVEHFYLIDNNSNDNPIKILQPYIDQGVITLYQLPGKYKQMTHVKYVYKKEKLQETTKWLINIDVDEYFYCKINNIYENLKNYENFYIIYSQWRDFGSSGLKIQPKDPRTAFTKRRKKLNWQGKYIIQTKYINLEDFESNPHHLSKADKKYKDNIFNLSDIFRLNHYRIMSLEYFQKVKMTRGSATMQRQDTNFRTLDYFKKYDEDNTYIDNDLRLLVLNQNMNDISYTNYMYFYS